jgi:hypothetical protein
MLLTAGLGDVGSHPQTGGSEACWRKLSVRKKQAVHGCDIELVRQGMATRNLSQALRETVLGQLKGASGGGVD